MLYDVIAALATPPGRSALAVIRVSGEGAHECVARVVPDFSPTPPRTLRLARAVSGSGDQLDQITYVAFNAPASYTGEDSVEITTHGGLQAPYEVLESLYRAGARAARPGEFTMRAVVHGKMDLLQAEAVGDLIEATSGAQREVALQQLNRGLSDRLARLRAGLLELEALVSYDIDFPEEDSGPVPESRIRDAIEDLLCQLKGLLETAAEGERLREGAVAVIAGRPNAGKSSLFNALLGSDRAIVTEVAGTTRDAIEAPVSCEGFPFRLVDTAGIQESSDRLEQLGIEVSRRYLRDADLVILCLEAGADGGDAERSFAELVSAPVLVARTKSDLNPKSGSASGETRVSAATGEGLDALRRRMAEIAFGELLGRASTSTYLTRARHRAAVASAVDELEQFARAREEGLEGAVAATHLRAAVGLLEEMVGVVTNEEILTEIFGRFCVGK